MSFLKNLNAYELHKHLINEYVLTSKDALKTLSRDASRDKTDADVIRENHRFLWDDVPADSWEKQLSKKYYDKLFKEYCICDLSLYKENKVALRWRTEKEVIGGKGQFECGNKKCTEKEELKSWEVNFAYVEEGEKKNALVKIRLCVNCSVKLNYRTKKREVKRLKKGDKSKRKSKDPEESTSTIAEEPKKTSDAAPILEVPVEADLWKKGHEPEEKSREEEFENYLEELLL